MIIIVRILYEFKDENFRVFSSEEIHEIINDYKTNNQINFVIYKTIDENKYEGLILEKNYSELRLNYFNDSSFKKFDSLKVNSILDSKFHINKFVSENYRTETLSFFEKLTNKNKIKNAEKFEKWKLKYNENEKKEKRKNIIRNIIILGSFVFVFFIGKFFLSDNFKFWGEETTRVYGKVNNISWHHWGRGYYYEIVHYTYKYNGKEFSNKSRIGNLTMFKSVKVKEIGDFVILKISKSNPENFKLIE
ncbi:hypothetical protein [Wenyingzhuangia sp. IMCC45467]